MRQKICQRPADASSTTVTRLYEDRSGNAILAYGTTVPSAVAGYALNCLFCDTDAASGTGWYTNTGTATSCTFTRSGQLADTAGAALVGLLDSGAFTAQTNVEAAIAEIYQDMFSATGGYIPLPLSAFRLIASSDIAAKNATDGGTISVDTDPKFMRVNVGTDKKLRIAWESASVIEITTDFSYPPDLDDTAALVVNLLMGMKAGSVDVPVVAVGYFEGVGDTNAGGNTAALSTTVAQKTVSIAASDVGTYPNGATISLVPAAHNTASNDVYLYGAWVTYKKKLRTS